ncbi:MAG TPA: hypothetical protein PLI96_07340 [Halothiobacillus sp.]|nr:hypothetical protein [Halothiobacillus sp.]
MDDLHCDWLTALSDDAFDAVLSCADEFFAINRALIHDHQTILTELLRDESAPVPRRWQHYPMDDVCDPSSGAMFYYHAHDSTDRPDEEHGHFHLFIRPDIDAAFSHFVALSLDARGGIRSVFTTNRWVTDEHLRPANGLIDLLPEAFVIERSRPSWLVSRWLMMVVRLLMPQIQQALWLRDSALNWDGLQALPDALLEDRARHILSEVPISMMDVLQQIQRVGLLRYPL